MIRVYNQTLDDGRILVNVHGRVCNQDHLKSRICANEGSASSFVQHGIATIVSETIIHYLNQRGWAGNHSQIASMEFWVAHSSLKQAFWNIETLPTLLLVNKVVNQADALKSILPAPASRFSSWIETIENLIAFCQSIAAVNPIPTSPIKS